MYDFAVLFLFRQKKYFNDIWHLQSEKAKNVHWTFFSYAWQKRETADRGAIDCFEGSIKINKGLLIVKKIL